MPKLDQYIAEVTVSVVLRSMGEGVVAEYSVTRKQEGPSHLAGAIQGADNVIDLVEGAFINATSAHHSMLHGVRNAENRRLK